MAAVRRLQAPANSEPTLAEWQQARVDVCRLMQRYGQGEDLIVAFERCEAAIARLEHNDERSRRIALILKGAA